MKVIPHGLKYTGFFDHMHVAKLQAEIHSFAATIEQSFSIAGGSRVRYLCDLSTEEEHVEPDGYYQDALESFLPELESRKWLRAHVRIEHGIQMETGTELQRPRNDEFFEIDVDREEGTCVIQCRLRERSLTYAFVHHLVDNLGLSSKPKRHSREIPLELETKLLCDSMHLCNACRHEGVVIHHIVPVEDGGKTEEDNLIVLCLMHHRQAHSKSALTKNLKPEHLREYKKRHAVWMAQQGLNDPLGLTPLTES